MATNGGSSDDADMAMSDGGKVVTMMDVLKEQEDFEEDANAVLGASDDKNCTYSKGYVKRQAIYACLTCCPEAKTDTSKRAGVCLACSLNCHENHELVELYTKRNFRCDCGNPKFNSHPCQFTPNKSDLNYENKYNQNFSGVYCVCHRPYPDPEATEEEEMIQCIICEDWLHENHLEATVPLNDQYAEMVCQVCMEDNDFLHDYSDLVINTVDKEVTEVDADLYVDITSIKKSTLNSSDLEKQDSINGKTDEKVESTSDDNKQCNVSQSSDVDMSETKTDNGTVHNKDESDLINNTKPEQTEKSAVTENSEETPESAIAEHHIDSQKESTDNIDLQNPENKANEVRQEVGTESEKSDEEKNCTVDTTETKLETEPGSSVAETEENNSDENETKKENLEAKMQEKIEEDSLLQNETEKNSTLDTVEQTNESPDAITETDKKRDVVNDDATESIKTKATEETKASGTVSTPNESTSEPGNSISDVTSDALMEVDKNVQGCEENKRKHSIEEAEDNMEVKKPKLDTKPCVRPRGVKRVFKGATFWPSNFRQKLCACYECIAMYKDLAVLFLIDLDDTVTAYEALGKEKIEGAPSSQYEKGLQALSSLDRVQQINALTEYNKMRDKLLEFLKSFKDRKEIVKEEDIKAFFAGMKPKREPDGVYFCR